MIVERTTALPAGLLGISETPRSTSSGCFAQREYHVVVAFCCQHRPRRRVFGLGILDELRDTPFKAGWHADIVKVQMTAVWSDPTHQTDCERDHEIFIEDTRC